MPSSTVVVHPLADLPVAQVLSLLSAERQAWAVRLLWDVGDISDTIEQAVRYGVLPGMAVTVGGRPVGYLSFHASQDLFRLCGAHLLEDSPPAGGAALVDAAVSQPAANDRRAEGQLMGFAHQETLDDAFRAHRFAVVARSYMVRAIQAEDAKRPLLGRLEAFHGTRLQDCARVLVAAHDGGVEAAINSAFRRSAPALAYLREIVKGSGCGEMLPRASWVALSRGRVAGFCLATTISPGVAHVPQVAVHPQAQGRGIGSRLLERTLRELGREGYERVTLGVSRDNARAAGLYERLGFVERTRFSAYFRDPG